jgi:hypothetical protein
VHVRPKSCEPVPVHSPPLMRCAGPARGRSPLLTLAPLSIDPLQQKDAALLVLGWLDEMLKSRRRPYRASLEGLLLTHVFPEFG